MVPDEVEDEEKIHRRTFSASQPIQASANQVVEDGEQLGVAQNKSEGDPATWDKTSV